MLARAYECSQNHLKVLLAAAAIRLVEKPQPGEQKYNRSVTSSLVEAHLDEIL